MEYRAAWLGGDLVAGVTLAAYAVPVSLAYAGLAGLSPQVGIYGYLLGGSGYALLGSSRQLAIGPTSAISLMIAGSVGAMAEGDAARYGQIASLAAFAVALLCLISWLLRLSMLVRLISDSILVGFKAGAGLTIMMTQLPSLFGVAGGGNNFFERAVLFAGQVGETQFLVLALGVAAILLLLVGERFAPGKPIGLAVVALSIVAASAFGLADLGVPTTGAVPAGLPSLEGPALRLRDVEGIFPLAVGCLLLAYIESVSAARTFATKHGYTLDPRQEFLGIGAAYRNRRSTTWPALARHLHSSSPHSRWPSACCFSLACWQTCPRQCWRRSCSRRCMGSSMFRRWFACGGSAEWTFTRRRSPSGPCCFSESCREYCLQGWRPY
jgi:MFS superfamily sulfate permease-like transporter